jgi:ketosteroid isomerase-like protein
VRVLSRCGQQENIRFAPEPLRAVSASPSAARSRIWASAPGSLPELGTSTPTTYGRGLRAPNVRAPGLARRILARQHGQMTDRARVRQWLADYETAWRAPGTEELARIFTTDATYLQSPYEQPVTGLDAIKRMWDEEREGPNEVFSLATEILAVDRPVAVVRAEVHYGDPVRQEYRDLWILRIGDDGRCTWFEEWPYWPELPYSASGDPREGDAGVSGS